MKNNRIRIKRDAHFLFKTFINVLELMGINKRIAYCTTTILFSCLDIIEINIIFSVNGPNNEGLFRLKRGTQHILIEIELESRVKHVKNRMLQAIEIQLFEHLFIRL